MESSIFTNTGHLNFFSPIVSVEFNSSVYISNCVFKENLGLYGSCLYCENNTTVTIENTSFVNNTAAKDAAIYCQNMIIDSKGNVTGTSSSDEHVETISLMSAEKLSLKIVISNCDFINNTAHDKGGAMYFKGSSIEIDLIRGKINNEASNDGSALYVEGKLEVSIQITIKYCHFGDEGDLGGGSIAISKAVMQIQNSNFNGLSFYEDANINVVKVLIILGH